MYESFPGMRLVMQVEVHQNFRITEPGTFESAGVHTLITAELEVTEIDLPKKFLCGWEALFTVPWVQDAKSFSDVIAKLRE